MKYTIYILFISLTIPLHLIGMSPRARWYAKRAIQAGTAYGGYQWLKKRFPSAPPVAPFWSPRSRYTKSGSKRSLPPSESRLHLIPSSTKWKRRAIPPRLVRRGFIRR